jgi:cholesterol oxidase
LSRMIGTRFSGNGDFLGFALRSHYRSGDNQVDRIVDPSLGPVITSVVRLPDQPRSHGTAYLEDGGYPDLVNWLIDNNAVIETGRLLRFLARRAVSYLTKDPTRDISAVVARRLISSGAFTATSLPLFGMGCEVPNGRMRLRGRLLDVDWSPRESLPYFRHLNRVMRNFTHQLGGTYLLNPIWILNLLATVHPLGGAPMGVNKDEGVVDPFGRVFDCPGLFIADGSVVPAPVGANPSLTIAALANRTADKVIERWESGSGGLEAGAS